MDKRPPAIAAMLSLTTALMLDDKVGVSTPPGDQMGAFEAQVEARMMSVGYDILVSEK